jgi:hypothetical protein
MSPDTQDHAAVREERVAPAEGCVFCKTPRDESAEGVEYETLSTGEILCSNCLADLRPYKRDRDILLFLNADYPDTEVMEDVSAAMREAAEETFADHGAEFRHDGAGSVSNARGYRPADDSAPHAGAGADAGEAVGPHDHGGDHSGDDDHDHGDAGDGDRGDE